MARQLQYSKQDAEAVFRKIQRKAVSGNQVETPGSVAQRAMANPDKISSRDILMLQRTVGNRAVVAMLSRKPATSSNLTVSAPGDRYEQEAERIAERVTRGAPSPAVPASGNGEAMPMLQRQTEDSNAVSHDVEQQLTATKSSGKKIPHEVRARMESRFDADFSAVRLHSGPDAMQLNHQLGAMAFTHGKDIYMGANAGSPGPASGDHLLAHELAHTMQQGAANHVRGWWPKGHRQVTELAIQKGMFASVYGPRALRLLIDRSPDIDFIQDEFDTMNKGIAQSKPRLDLYKRLIQTDRTDEARSMWEKNELHMRRPEYMLSHGEGGRYRVKDGSSLNEAMTSRLVTKAVGLWNWDDKSGKAKGRSLEVLSDALHQAEDRGSHSEGNAFSGHDVRLGLPKWLKNQGRARAGWEIIPPDAPGKDWEPDNFSVNKNGAKVGVAFAEGTLNKFATMVQASAQRPIELETKGGAVVSPERRKMVPFKGMQGVTSSSHASKAPGKTGGSLKKLAELFMANKDGKLDNTAYEQAKAIPVETNAPEEFRAEGGGLDKGMAFYEHGTAGLTDEADVNKQTEAEIMTKAFIKFKKWGQAGVLFGRGVSQERRIANCKKYYNDEVAKYEGPMKDVAKRAIQAAYRAIFAWKLDV